MGDHARSSCGWVHAGTSRPEGLAGLGGGASADSESRWGGIRKSVLLGVSAKEGH